MLERPEPAVSLSIARHALQFILRSALDAEPEQCFGLIGRKNGLTINYAASFPNIRIGESIEEVFKNSDLKHILKAWTAEGITPCGTFFTTSPEAFPGHATLEKVETAMRRSSSEFADKAFIHMPLMLNTAGCLEAFSYLINEISLISIPLILEEDGEGSADCHSLN